jgi:hypothetical protein
VQNCQFLDGGSLLPYTLRIDGSDSTVVTGNTFSSAKTGDTAVQIVDSDGVTVAHNSITLTGGVNQDTGIEVQTNLRDAGADLHDNIIKTATTAGSGIVTSKTTGHQLTAKIQNNDLSQNFIGLYVLGDDAQLGNIDAGSPQGSTGGNNFQGFTPNMNGREAIQIQFAATGTVEAQFNKWSVFLPATVVAPASGTTIVTGGTISLAGLAKFAQLIGLPLASAYPALNSSPLYGDPGWLVGAAATAQPAGLGSADLMPAGSTARAAFFKAFASPGYARVAHGARFSVGHDLGPAELPQFVNALDAGGSPALALAQALATEVAGCPDSSASIEKPAVSNSSAGSAAGAVTAPLGQSTDIESLVFEVMMEAAKDAQNDLKDCMNQISSMYHADGSAKPAGDLVFSNHPDLDLIFSKK